MAKTFTVTDPSGRTLEVEGDAVPTEAELEEIFAAIPAPKSAAPMRPMASHDPEPPRTLTQNAGDVAVGAGKSLARTASGLVRILTSSGSPLSMGGLTTPVLDTVDTKLKPSNDMQRYGGMGADVATSIVPIGRAAKFAAELPLAARLATNAAAGYAVNRAQGHDGSPLSAVVGAVLPEATSTLFKAGGRALASSALGSTNDAAENVLNEGLLWRGAGASGARKAEGRIANEVSSSIADAGPAARVNVGRVPQSRAVTSTMRRLSNADADMQAAGDTVQRFTNNPTLTKPSVQNMLEATEGRRTTALGVDGTTADVQRAVAAGGRSEVARSVPAVAGRMGRIDRLADASETLARAPQRDLLAGPFSLGHGVIGPLMSTGVGRFAGSAGQALNSTARRVLDPAVARAALLELMTSDASKHQVSDGGNDPSTWDKRPDGSSKGNGYLGVQSRPDGRVSSEISVGVQDAGINGGKETDIPTMVPTLTADEVKQLLSLDVGRQKIPAPIMAKALAFARQRSAAGLPLFADGGR